MGVARNLEADESLASLYPNRQTFVSGLGWSAFATTDGEGVVVGVDAVALGEVGLSEPIRVWKVESLEAAGRLIESGVEFSEHVAQLDARFMEAHRSLCPEMAALWPAPKLNWGMKPSVIAEIIVRDLLERDQIVGGGAYSVLPGWPFENDPEATTFFQILADGDELQVEVCGDYSYYGIELEDCAVHAFVDAGFNRPDPTLIQRGNPNFWIFCDRSPEAVVGLVEVFVETFGLGSEDRFEWERSNMDRRDVSPEDRSASERFARALGRAAVADRLQASDKIREIQALVDGTSESLMRRLADSGRYQAFVAAIERGHMDEFVDRIAGVVCLAPVDSPVLLSAVGNLSPAESQVFVLRHLIDGQPASAIFHEAVNGGMFTMAGDVLECAYLGVDVYGIGSTTVDVTLVEEVGASSLLEIPNAVRAPGGEGFPSLPPAPASSVIEQEDLIPLLESKMSEVLSGSRIPTPHLPVLLMQSYFGLAESGLWRPWSWVTCSEFDPEICYLGIGFPAERGQGCVELASDFPDFWAFAHDGHGINSYGLGLSCRLGPLVVDQQVGWGGIYMDLDESTSKAGNAVRVWNETLTYFEALGPIITTPTDPLILVRYSDYRQYEEVVLVRPDGAWVTPESASVSPRLAPVLAIARDHLERLQAIPHSGSPTRRRVEVGLPGTISGRLGYVDKFRQWLAKQILRLAHRLE